MIHRMIICLLFLTTSIHAASPALDNITKENFENIAREFSANFVHSAVTPATKLGDVFGIEVGLVAGATKIPEAKKIAQSSDTDSDFDAIPHAAVLAHVAIPFGFSFEATMFPERTASDVTLKTFSGAIKWNPDLPIVDLQIRGHFGSGELTYKTQEKVSSVPVDSAVKYDTSSYGLNLVVGTDLFFLKPYAGIGYVSTSSELGVSASSGTIFDSSFTTAQSAKKDSSGAHLFAGAEFDLFFIHIGAEVQKLLDVTKASVKLSLAF